MAASKKKKPAKAARKAARKPAVKKQTSTKRASARKPAPKKSAAKKKPAPAKKAPARKQKTAKVAKAARPSKKAPAKRSTRASKAKKSVPDMRTFLAYGQPVEKSRRLNPWLKRQQLRLLELKDTALDSMAGVARDNLRTGNDSHEVSAHGLHQADAGSDAYDRDFALNLLSQEQDALSEIDAALKRITLGTYGTCEISGKPIPKARLEARPFARYTVQCQSELEKKNRFSRVRQPITRLFETVEDESSEESDDESTAENKD